jgi:hypothetical protein
MLCVAGVDRAALSQLLRRYGLHLQLLPPQAPIPGSYWGEREAGLHGAALYARADTPLHSVLHEAAHYLCMSDARRATLERDAGGDDLEEAAVCYLQLLLAEALPGAGRLQQAADMDSWGYSFRLGSTAAWFAGDAADARAWLCEHGLIDMQGRLTGRLARHP